MKRSETRVGQIVREFSVSRIGEVDWGYDNLMIVDTGKWKNIRNYYNSVSGITRTDKGQGIKVVHLDRNGEPTEWESVVMLSKIAPIEEYEAAMEYVRHQQAVRHAELDRQKIVTKKVQEAFEGIGLGYVTTDRWGRFILDERIVATLLAMAGESVDLPDPIVNNLATL